MLFTNHDIVIFAIASSAHFCSSLGQLSNASDDSN